LKQRLMKLDDAPKAHTDVESWLKLYLTEKYNLLEIEKDMLFGDTAEIYNYKET